MSRGRLGLHAFLMTVSLAFLAPLLLAIYASLRPYEETAKYGYFSLPRHLSFDYYAQAFNDSGMGKYFINSLIIAVPGVLLTLFLASFVAFCVTRLRMRGGLVLLMVFTAGNLLPQQVIVTPLYVLFTKINLPYWMSDSMTMYDSYWAVLAVQVAFQVGFCVFVLANFMRTLPEEIVEAARVDGAGYGRSTGTSRFRCAGRPSPRSPPCNSPGCTTTSCGRSSSSPTARSCPSPPRSTICAASSSPTTTCSRRVR
ncbi:hypothetical protein GCM10017744_086020 [Streptomyces antimycoticus]